MEGEGAYRRVQGSCGHGYRCGRRGRENGLLAYCSKHGVFCQSQPVPWGLCC